MNAATIVTMDKLMMNVTVISSMISYYLNSFLTACNKIPLALQWFSIYSVVIPLLKEYTLFVFQGCYFFFLIIIKILSKGEYLDAFIHSR